MKNDQVVNNEVVVEVAEVAENNEKVSKTNGLMAKAKTIGKKHGKKIIAGIAIVTAVGLSYAFGKNAGLNESSDTNQEDYGTDDDYDYYSENNEESDDTITTTEF